MANVRKPKGAYSKVGGVGGVKFTGKTKEEKFQNYISYIGDTSETRKDRFEDTSRLYAAARKLGINQSSVKKQIDTLAKEKAKYGAAAEKKASKMDMEDMMRRSAENRKLKTTKPSVVKAASKTTTKKPAISRTPAKAVKTPMPKVGNAPSKRVPMAKPLTGPAAVAELQRQVSPGGMKKSEAAKKKATDKKYPGLYKKSK